MERNEFWQLFRTYSGISEMMKKSSHEEIARLAADAASVDVDYLESYPMDEYFRGRTNNNHRFVLEDMFGNIEYYDWLYDRLADERSKEVFTLLMQFRLIPDMSFIRTACDGEDHRYFDRTVMDFNEKEVFVDCGGRTGDTAEDYIRQYGKYQRIYVYEPSEDNVKACRENLKEYPGITVRKCGVGEKHMRVKPHAGQSTGSFGYADETVEVISLDEDIREKITFLKTDTEGFEIPAILGAKNHIREDAPGIVASVCHMVSDLWEIPRLIGEIRPDYRFYLRHYGKDHNWETVLYAVLEKQLSGKRSGKASPGKIVAMAPYERGWSNVELIKDCGLIPYLLHKNHGYEVSMVGAEGDRYTNHEKYVKGIRLEFLPNGQPGEKVRYIHMHAEEMSGLLLRGCYPGNFPVAKEYKRLNPDGKIYVGLDANSWWMDRIFWDNRDFMDFMDCCDVIATSCRAMQDYLNEKWPWKIEYIPNGYYDFSPQPETTFEQKENIILTVGRLGTVQKATEVLLEAFAQIAEQIPEWKVRLVGSTEAKFHGYCTDYFRRYPKLSERVTFVGTISDRDMLLGEYRAAKIFALPSSLEGGTPNVISEALHGGCVTAVTRFDAYEDATDAGRCGESAEIGDVAGFARILHRLCTSPDLERLSEHARQYAEIRFDMEKAVTRVNEMMFGGVDEKN